MLRVAFTFPLIAGFRKFPWQFCYPLGPACSCAASSRQNISIQVSFLIIS